MPKKRFDWARIFRAFFESSIDIVWLNNGEGRLLEVNSRFCELLGYSRKELLTMLISDIDVINPTPLQIRKLLAEIRSKGKMRFQTVHKCKDGHLLDIEVYSHFVGAENEDVFLAFHRDITESKRLERELIENRDYLKEIVEERTAELRRLNDELERRVEERTSELKKAQEQLLQQERLAVLGQLTAGLAHELRQPLSAIQNAAYLLNMVLADTSSEVKEALEILNCEVASSDRIINSLLDFTRRSPVIKQRANVNDIIRSAISRCTIPKKIKVNSQLGDSLPAIMVDPDKLERAFSNIILNAFQAMPGVGLLTIQSNMLDSQWVSVSFTDTGVSIPEENLEKVFEPLFTTKGIGIGLGLTIAKTMVMGHGGTIEVQSKVGQGSTFTIKLPTT